MNGVPFGSFGFKVSVEDADGNQLGCFQEVSGLSVQVNVTDIVEGGVNHTTRKMLGNASYSNIVLKRGFCDGSMLSWLNKFVNRQPGKLKRLTVFITILDDMGTMQAKDAPAVAKYKIDNAIPVKWDGPTLNVMQDAIATETLELAHEGLSVEPLDK